MRGFFVGPSPPISPKTAAGKEGGLLQVLFDSRSMASHKLIEPTGKRYPQQTRSLEKTKKKKNGHFCMHD